MTTELRPEEILNKNGLPASENPKEVIWCEICRTLGASVEFDINNGNTAEAIETHKSLHIGQFVVLKLKLPRLGHERLGDKPKKRRRPAPKLASLKARKARTVAGNQRSKNPSTGRASNSKKGQLPACDSTSAQNENATIPARSIIKSPAPAKPASGDKQHGSAIGDSTTDQISQRPASRFVNIPKEIPKPPPQDLERIDQYCLKLIKRRLIDGKSVTCDACGGLLTVTHRSKEIQAEPALRHVYAKLGSFIYSCNHVNCEYRARTETVIKKHISHEHGLSGARDNYKVSCGATEEVIIDMINQCFEKELDECQRAET